MKTKYIIDEINGFLIFPEYIQHDMAAKILTCHGYEILGAGFVDLSGGVVTCYGESISLGIKSRGQEDAEILARKLKLEC